MEILFYHINLLSHRHKENSNKKKLLPSRPKIKFHNKNSNKNKCYFMIITILLITPQQSQTDSSLQKIIFHPHDHLDLPSGGSSKSVETEVYRPPSRVWSEAVQYYTARAPCDAAVLAGTRAVKEPQHSTGALHRYQAGSKRGRQTYRQRTLTSKQWIVCPKKLKIRTLIKGWTSACLLSTPGAMVGIRGDLATKKFQN